MVHVPYLQADTAFLERSLKTSSLVSLGVAVPEFVASTAHAAEAGGDNILVVVELSGGNDGLNTVIPYGDDLYHKARPTLRFKKGSLLIVDEHIGLHSQLRALDELRKNGSLAIVQGVGYPNPNRSHFESKDTWHTADPKRKLKNGWLGRSLNTIKVAEGRIPALHLGAEKLPLALTGSSAGVPTFDSTKPFGLQLSGIPGRFQGAVFREATGRSRSRNSAQQPVRARKPPDPRMQSIRELTESSADDANELLGFVRRTSLRTYATIDTLREIVDERFQRTTYGRSTLQYQLALISGMIAAGFGTRVFYVSLSGFDTHSGQLDAQGRLLAELGGAVGGFFLSLKKSGHAERVVLMTFSEFGRRVRENGSGGTDHGAASNMFVVGPAVKAGVIGKHPSLKPDQLDHGDLKYHTDFRRVYATLLDGWLGADSRRVLGQAFQPLDLLKSQIH